MNTSGLLQSRLLSHLLIFSGSLYCKQYKPRSDYSLIRTYSVYFHDKIQSEVHLSTCSIKSDKIFRTKKNIGWIMVNHIKPVIKFYYIGSYIGAYVLLNLLNKLRNREKICGIAEHFIVFSQ